MTGDWGLGGGREPRSAGRARLPSCPGLNTNLSRPPTCFRASKVEQEFDLRSKSQPQSTSNAPAPVLAELQLSPAHTAMSTRSCLRDFGCPCPSRTIFCRWIRLQKVKDLSNSTKSAKGVFPWRIASRRAILVDENERDSTRKQAEAEE